MFKDISKLSLIPNKLESIPGVFVKKGGIGISSFTTPTDKRLSHMMHPASKYNESRQLSRHST